jgi:hypothetical protein
VGNNFYPGLTLRGRWRFIKLTRADLSCLVRPRINPAVRPSSFRLAENFLEKIYFGIGRDFKPPIGGEGSFYRFFKKRFIRLYRAEHGTGAFYFRLNQFFAIRGGYLEPHAYAIIGEVCHRFPVIIIADSCVAFFESETDPSLVLSVGAERGYGNTHESGDEEKKNGFC